MFGEKLDRKVSQIEETRIIGDCSLLTENVGRKTRNKRPFDNVIFASRGRHFEMLAASIYCKVYYTMLSNKNATSRVPRCLFGKPNPRETIEMLHEALDMERNRFKSRWAIDPRSEDKENNYQRKNNEQSPSRKRNHPYSRQTSIHDYWRARKICEVNKKPLTASTDASKQLNVEPSKTAAKTTSTATTTTTTTTTTKKTT